MNHVTINKVNKGQHTLFVRLDRSGAGVRRWREAGQWCMRAVRLDDRMHDRVIGVVVGGAWAMMFDLRGRRKISC